MGSGSRDAGGISTQRPSCVVLPLASRPPFRPPPHQVQRGASAQVLHDNPQLRALGPEKCLSAGIWQRTRRPQDTHPGAPRGPSHNGLQQPPTSLPITPTAAALQTGQVLKPATSPLCQQPFKPQAGRTAAQPSTPAYQGALHSPQLALGSGLQLQGSLPVLPAGPPRCRPWGLPQPRDMAQPGEARAHTANPEPLRLHTLLVLATARVLPRMRPGPPTHPPGLGGPLALSQARPPAEPGAHGSLWAEPRLQAPSGRSRSSG